MPYDLQSKLLRVLQENYIRRVGGTKDIPVRARIIATVNEPPEELMAQGKLRKDLYYRLNVVNLWIPALCLILSTGGLIGMGVASRRKKKKGGR